MTKWRKGIMILLLLVGIAGSTLVISMGALGSPPRSSLTVSPTQLTFNAVAGGPPASRTKYQCDGKSSRQFHGLRVCSERRHKLAVGQSLWEPDDKPDIECNREPDGAGGGDLQRHNHDQQGETDRSCAGDLRHHQRERVESDSDPDTTDVQRRGRWRGTDRAKCQRDRDYTNVVYRERVGAERKHKLAGAQPFGKPDNKSNIECNREPGRAGGGNL